MSIIDQINHAIASHGMWKARLRKAIDTGKSEWTVTAVLQDDQCEFGKWLHSLPATVRATEQWKNVYALHAEFHTVAAGVLDLALKGHREEASAAINLDSRFASVSGKLTTAMMSWKKAGS